MSSNCYKIKYYKILHNVESIVEWNLQIFYTKVLDAAKCVFMLQCGIPHFSTFCNKILQFYEIQDALSNGGSKFSDLKGSSNR